MNDFPEIDFHEFHLRDLPGRLASGNGVLAAMAARELPSIGFILKDSDHAYSYMPGSESIAIVAGTEAETIIEIEASSWQGLVHDLESAPVWCMAIVLR
ncbi:hypothetical protein [Oceanicoccus sp. KOV_DT_Chl]|uniref:hypothetical protein n=1 Tax=Oceanicoccus sp. KOV_DT_Chl TaxID=1904639 RepID=UPI000C7A1B56|nr:hypothetical protein [Oceanicoccus sp. KOV_DT_Chl]